MAERIWHYRFTPDDLEELQRSLERLNQLHDSIDRTAIPAKPAMKLLCVEVYRFLERLAQKESAIIQRWQARQCLPPGETETPGGQ